MYSIDVGSLQYFKRSIDEARYRHSIWQRDKRRRKARPYVGPVHGFLIKQDNTTVSFNLKKKAIDGLDPFAYKAFVFDRRGKYEFSAQWNRLNGNTGWATASTKEEIIQEVLKRQQEETDYQNRMETDPEFCLEELLKRHDWYYAFSDDHRYWVSGEAASKRIKAKRNEVGEDVFKRLWDQYCPWAKEDKEKNVA